MFRESDRIILDPFRPGKSLERVRPTAGGILPPRAPSLVQLLLASGAVRTVHPARKQINGKG